MTFRRQLVLSILLLVLVPVALAGVAIGWIVNSNEHAKTDAQLAAALRVTGVLVDGHTRTVERRLEALERDAELRVAIAAADPARLDRALTAVVREHEIAAARAVLPSGEVVLAGDQEAIGVARVAVRDAQNRPVQLSFGAATPAALVREVDRITGVPLRLVSSGGRTVASAAGFPPEEVVNMRTSPPRTEARWRVRSTELVTVRGRPLTALAAGNPQQGDVAMGWVLVAAVLLALTVIGFGLALVLVRALRQRVERFVTAAERVGGGDFAAADALPTGDSEFGRLGRAFVDMADELDHRIRQLAQERQRVRTSLDRLGQAFAANLNRNQLVELVVDAVVTGTNAAAGRALLPMGSTSKLEEHGATAGVHEVDAALSEAERRCLDGRQPAALAIDGVYAMAEPIALEGEDRVGAVSVARDEPFGPDERALLRYLTRQAEVSLRNVGRHEDVARESITDDLTGLANRRRFDDVLSSVVGRASAEAPVALVMIDLDHFKTINDTHGHPFGDRVLRAVADVVAGAARDRDLPARYGGEELAVIMARGDVAAAKAFAERLRRKIEALRLGDNQTGPVRVTASLGVASLPADGSSAGDLVRAADEALYRAKRNGRNRVEASTPVPPVEGKVR